MNARVDLPLAFADWMAARQAVLEPLLERLLPPGSEAPARLHQAMRYAVLGGGKRVRPLLAYAAGEAVGAAGERLDRCAAAIELMHCYSLIHDDLPCMDDDVLRRGRPTAHVEFDEATALLAGDALQCLAFDVLCQAGADPAAIILLARASGSRGMAGGQAIDLESIGGELPLAQLELMHRMKTGALIRAAVLLGASCGAPLEASQRAAFEHYADAVGLAFQIVDDILDAEATTQALGKTAGKDAAHNKPNYVAALGLAGAKARAAELRDHAHAALAPFAHRAARLRNLAELIIVRSS